MNQENMILKNENMNIFPFQYKDITEDILMHAYWI